MQVPFRRYMKEPGLISGSASPQSEDRPSHKEIPIANDRRTSAHDRTRGRTEREFAYAVATCAANDVCCYICDNDGCSGVGAQGKGSEAAKSGSALAT